MIIIALLIIACLGLGLGFLRSVSDITIVAQTTGFLCLAGVLTLLLSRKLKRVSQKASGSTAVWLRRGSLFSSLSVFILLAIVIIWFELISVYSFQDYSYQRPEQLEDGWETSSLSAEGLDEAAFTKVLEDIHHEQYGSMYSVLIVKNGKLVLESYHWMNDRDKPQYVRSVTKSVASLLIGIAKDQGNIKNLDSPIFDYLPQELKDLRPSDREIPTLRNVLTMTSGYRWKESGGYRLWDLANDSIWLLYSPRPFRFVLQRPMAQPPGTHFLYNTGNSLLLSAVISGTTGMDAAQFAAKNLFEPLGMVGYGWFWSRGGYPHTGGGLYLRARDMAKIGQLILYDGVYRGKRIISSEWIQDSIRIAESHPKYGYQWWLAEFVSDEGNVPVIYAAGDGGQMIYSIPKWQTVMVLTSSKLGVTPGDASRVAMDLATAF